MPGRPRLVTPTFVVVTLSALTFFIALGLLMPVLPLYVEGPLNGGGLAVGIAVGSFSFSAAFLRPFTGRLGDRAGRRVLVVAGALAVAASVAAYTVANSLASLVALRLVTGVGEAAMFVGAATAIQDLAPPDRRGEAASYFSVAIYGGLAVGPALGEWILDEWGYDAVWLVAAAWCVAGAVLGRWTPVGGVTPMAAGGDRAGRLLHRAALLPGTVLGLSLVGFAGFSTFVPLYVDDIGLSGARTAFAIYATLVLAVRILGARIPDRAGPVATGSVALVALAAGLAVMAALRSPAGLYGGTVLFALGMSLLFPALMVVVVDNAPDAERSSAVATFSIFFDLSQGVGALALGGVVALGGEPASFAVGAVLAVAALVVLRRGVAPTVRPRHVEPPVPVAPGA